MKHTDFKSLIESVLIVEEKDRESKEIDERLKKFGYGTPQPGADGHVTFTHHSNPSDQILIDVPGGEWHHMVKGVINIVGDLDNNTLEKYLEKHFPEKVEKVKLKEGFVGTKKTYEIEASPNMIGNFERFIRHLQYCAGVGHSATVGMDIDGDGADRFKVNSPELPKLKEGDITNRKGSYEAVYCDD